MAAPARVVFLMLRGSLTGAGAAFLIFAALCIGGQDGVVLHGLMRGYRWLMSCRLAFIGANLAYGIYLVHIILIQVHQTIRPLEWMTFWRFLELFFENSVGSALVALVLFLLVEKPIMNMRF